ncbi:helix-turn-helix domain-containing protein [Amycolatopsis sp. NPDC098790]|uniref:helix-turn-helix domain-containing protein n=1 Tax=Amycolatopsis sp. NPDC098790 TaxID=3363939 RepID=UPI003812C0D2
MAGNARYRDLGDRLEQLKAGSGHSYTGIGRKIYLSKSAVHRYCTGVSAPKEFGVVERIALACGASRDEIVALHRLWLRATAPAEDVAEDVVQEAESTPTEAALRPAPAEPARFPRRRRRWLLPGVVTAMAAFLAVVLVSSTAGPDPVADARAQRIGGPAWKLPPAPVPSTFFGVTINSATGRMPSFHVGAARFWDGGTRWSEIQRLRGEFDWSTLDRLVAGAEEASLPSLFVFGGTPRWASPGGPAGPYPEGTPAPPVDLADWDRFVGSVVTRYRGRIDAYELWVLANDRRFYAGNVETLVEMTRRAAAIIRSGDPRATVVCPGMGQLWTPEGVSFLRRFADSNGYDQCDVASVKLFQQRASDPPESMLELTTTIDRVMHEAGVHPRLWNTGTTYSIATQAPLDETTARNHAVRFFLVGLYARKVNLERMYFYNWGGTRVPIVLQPVGGTPTAAALAVEVLQRWLRRAQSRSCGHGTTAGLPENVWKCEFTVIEPDRTYDAVIQWTDRGTATLTAGAGARRLHRLDETEQPVRPGDPIIVSEEPALVLSDPTGR